MLSQVGIDLPQLEARILKWLAAASNREELLGEIFWQVHCCWDRTGAMPEQVKYEKRLESFGVRS